MGLSKSANYGSMEVGQVWDENPDITSATCDSIALYHITNDPTGAGPSSMCSMIPQVE